MKEPYIEALATHDDPASAVHLTGRPARAMPSKHERDHGNSSPQKQPPTCTINNYMKRTILLCAALALSSCVTKPPALSDPPVPNVCPYDIVGPCFKQSANYGGTYQLARLLAGIVF